MKTLSNYIEEKLVINKEYNKREIKVSSHDELLSKLEEIFKNEGPGTKDKPINLNNLDVSEVIEFNSLFKYLDFKYIDISDWELTNATNVENMFSSESLISVGDLSDWKFPKLKKMIAMFYKCKNLQSVGDISNWDISNVKSISLLFAGCFELTNIGDISDWNIQNLISSRSMFLDCNMLRNVGDLNKWKIVRKPRTLTQLMNKINNKDFNADYMFSNSIVENTPIWYKKYAIK